MVSVHGLSLALNPKKLRPANCHSYLSFNEAFINPGMLQACFCPSICLAYPLKILALQHCPARQSHYHLDSRPVLYFKTMELIHTAPSRALLDLCTITRMPTGRRVKMRRPLGFANTVNSTSSYETNRRLKRSGYKPTVTYPSRCLPHEASSSIRRTSKKATQYTLKRT